ncbi:MAG: hydroxymethylglutaryl-CoA lyase [Thermoflexibacter sp.]|jgi:hydroxymethylglutaryl-CoA lyase|nr:hydroxymethylglutaryl-CoA lyase [Thermoflexibacter sp.]
MSTFPHSIIIEEQGLRDGLQSEKILIPTEKKIEFANRLVEAGLRRIQLTAFVHPKFVPQMSDAEEVFAGVDKTKNVIFSALVLNMKGLERAIKAGATHLSISISASDTHSRKNTNMSLLEALKEFKDMVREAKKAQITVRGGIQCAFGCRYEGKIAKGHVLDLARQHIDLGVDELALADSTGMGNPLAMKEMMTNILAMTKDMPVILHLHDTEGKGLANMLAAMETGVSYFDTAFGGLGGCPFIKGATGNISTEDTTYMLSQMNIQTGIDIVKIAQISRELEGLLGKQLSGKMHHIILENS